MKINQNKTVPVENAVDSEKVQEKMVKEAYVHHDHGGREHGHDWDDWAKAERSTKSNKKKNT